MLPANNRLELARRMIAVGSFIFHAAQLKRDPLGGRDAALITTQGVEEE